jgi:translation initiation factor 4G
MQNPQPARSPSPIPQPAASGGRPPAGLTGPSQLNFGALPGADGADAAVSISDFSSPSSITPPTTVSSVDTYHGSQSRLPLPQGPAAQIPGATHLRRESSQASHNSDMSPAMNNRNSFMPNGRGQPFRPMPYQNPIAPHSPQPQFRQNVPQGRGNPPNMPMYPQQGRMPNSPYAGRGTPAMPGNAMPQQPHWAGGAGMPYGGAPGFPTGYAPQNVGFLPPTLNFPIGECIIQTLTHPQPQGMYGMPQQLDPSYQVPYGYGPQYQQQLYPGMQFQGGAPPSPRNYPPAQASYTPNYNPQAMSRQSSQGPERPASTVGQPSTPSVPATQASPTPGPSSSSPGNTQQFQPPKRGSKAIQIKRPDGTEVNLDKLTSPPPPAQPNRGPTVISSATGTPSSSTPPPQRNASVSAPSHVRSDSLAKKTAEEKAAEFKEQFKRQLAAEKEEEKRAEEEKLKKAEEEKAAKEKEAKEKEEAERKAKEAEAAAKAAKEKEEAEKAAKLKEEDEAEKARKEAEEKKRQEDEEMDRWIAEMEAKEKEEEERNRKYEEERKKKLAEEKARKATEAKEPTDEDLRRQEREAEEAELAKEKAAKATDEENAKLFASLKKSTLGPAATASESGASTPAAVESPVPQPAQLALPTPPKTSTPLSGKPKPAALKLETHKPVEPAQPTAGMQSLKSARYLDVKNLDKIYPDGVKSPNPALNATARGRGRKYDKDFLMQFQTVFKEKPSTEWDKILKETVGDTSDSARPQSARTPSMGGRQNSRPPMGTGMNNVMGNFGAPGRTLPPGTNSAQRFMAAEAHRGGPMPSTFAFPGRPGSGFPMGAPMARQGSGHSHAQQGGMNSPRAGSRRGPGGSRRGPGAEEAKLAKTMPLTVGMDLKPLEVSKTGWKPASIVQPNATLAAPGGHLPPDLVQRKVKANLNKMTPEKFEKISDDILHIAMQSKDEQDGRTLRQVIQLTFEKACDEAHWASMYAKFCKRMLETMSQEIKDENVRDKAGNPVVGGALFRKYLLNRCQEEFERGWEVNLPDKPEGDTQEAVLLSDEYYVAAAAKRRGLGLIQFIGELYKLDMLTIRIMHECVYRLLNFEGIPDESAVESLVKLLRTVGGKMEENPNGRAMLDSYFERIKTVMDQEGLPSRMYYMLLVSLTSCHSNVCGELTIILGYGRPPKEVLEVQRRCKGSQNHPADPRGRGRRPASRGSRTPAPELPRWPKTADGSWRCPLLLRWRHDAPS